MAEFPRRYKVLVVDDDQDTRDLLRQILEHEGYEVAEARDARQAIHELGDDVLPDVIIVDARMPGMSGEAFVTAIARDRVLAAIPVILQTGDREAHLEASAFGFMGAIRSSLFKPYPMDWIVQIVAGCCKLAAAERSQRG